MGDLIYTSPAIRCIKKQLPQSTLHFFTKKTFAPLFECNPYLDKLHYLEQGDSLWHWIAVLKKNHYDVVIDLHNSLRSRIVCFFLGKKILRFHKNRKEEKLMIAQKWKPQHRKHLVERYLETLLPLGVTHDNKGMDYFLPTDTSYFQKELETYINSTKYVAFIIGATHWTKRMPNEKIAELIKKIDLPVLLIGGKDVEANGKFLEEQFADKHIFNTCGKWGIHQSVYAIKHATAVVGFDTGLTHIAEAFDKKLAIIWGGTTPYVLGVEPYKVKQYYNAEVHLPCRPCSKFGLEECPEKHFQCMYRQDLDSIASFIRKMK